MSESAFGTQYTPSPYSNIQNKQYNFENTTTPSALKDNQQSQKVTFEQNYNSEQNEETESISTTSNPDNNSSQIKDQSDSLDYTERQFDSNRPLVMNQISFEQQNSENGDKYSTNEEQEGVDHSNESQSKQTTSSVSQTLESGSQEDQAQEFN